MSSHTVDWAALRVSTSDAAETIGLRERRKRATRQTLIDTATEMFIDRGFDAVTVAEIAEECGVAPATVFNYFPTKESLILDLPVALMSTLRATLADPSIAPLLKVLFQANFARGCTIFMLEDLPDLAEEAGLEPSSVRQLLDNPDSHLSAVRADEREAADLGITGVPNFRFDHRIMVSGAQSVSSFSAVLQTAWSGRISAASGAASPT